MTTISDEMAEHLAKILDSHVKVGRHKPVSFLPIETIENIIGLTVSAYTSLVEKSGNKWVVLGPEECCIKSGAVYAYSEDELGRILNGNIDILSRHQWPVDSDSFIRRIAFKWLDEHDPLIPVIRASFGD